jgi:hypothetical protein
MLFPILFQDDGHWGFGGTALDGCAADLEIQSELSSEHVLGNVLCNAAGGYETDENHKSPYELEQNNLVNLFELHPPVYNDPFDVPDSGINDNSDIDGNDIKDEGISDNEATDLDRHEQQSASGADALEMSNRAWQLHGCDLGSCVEVAATCHFEDIRNNQASRQSTADADVLELSIRAWQLHGREIASSLTGLDDLVLNSLVGLMLRDVLVQVCERLESAGLALIHRIRFVQTHGNRYEISKPS